MIDATMCPECGEQAEVPWRAVLDSTDGPIEYARVLCVRGHWFLMPVADLAASAPTPWYPPGRSGFASAGRGGTRGGRLRIVLLCSAFNGLSQRVWVELRSAGHQVSVLLAGDDDAVRAAVSAADPDLVICPFLRERIPAQVWRTVPSIVIHPGPRGDRGPSSLDWAIMNAEPAWGVTAVQAVQEMDAGPIWASRTFSIDPVAPRKSALYNGPVTEAAVQLIGEVVAKFGDPQFVAEPLDYTRPDVVGRARPAARQADRQFSWADPTEVVLRRIRAADGSPGVHVSICELPVSVYDAHPQRDELEDIGPGAPGTVASRRHGAVLVRTGDGEVWIGQLRCRDAAAGPNLKLPATTVLADRIADVPQAPPSSAGYREISYHRDVSVGVLDFAFYNGAMSTDQCERLQAALRHATSQDTRVLLLRGGQPFSNGIHLGVIEAAADPAAEAWANIIAIDDVCQQIITCTDQLLVCGITGNAGAGGVMLALGADRVLLRHGAVLNPHYASMGLFGSEYWTHVLPRRIGEPAAHSLTTQCLPIGADQAVSIGLADQTLPGTIAQFHAAAFDYATRLATNRAFDQHLDAKRARRERDEQRRPLSAYRDAELDQMHADIFDDRHGFARARAAFLTHAKPAATPRRVPARSLVSRPA